jgi:UPF0755 protein
MKKNLLIISAIILLLAFLYPLFELLLPVHSRSGNIEIVIPKGATFRQAAEILYNEKLIRDKKIFILLGRLTGTDKKIRAGYYSIWSSMSPLDIFRIIRKGHIVEYEVKILEGDSLLEIAAEFEKAGISTKEKFMELSKDRDFLSSYEIESPSIEGYLFPDTYIIPKGIDAEEAVGIMIDLMREKYSGKLSARTKEIGMTENQVLALASIIEKEAVADDERPLISAVYHNRLKKKMPLQADPTSIYGIKSSKEKITSNDLKRKTPYNTYTIKGLPPGPIASPGLKSIIAALYPSDVPYIYFVAGDDRTHQFSSTISEHLKAVKLLRERNHDRENKKEGPDDAGSS